MHGEMKTERRSYVAPQVELMSNEVRRASAGGAGQITASESEFTGLSELELPDKQALLTLFK
jgi:hypothetical protein